jgi:putative ABC transport system permease protein
MRGWFFYFLRRAIQQRMGRFLISSFSVLLTVSLLTALMIISTGLRQKMGRQLSAYGANMIVSADGSGSIPIETAQRVSALSGVREFDYHLYGEISLGSEVVEVVGLDVSKARGLRVRGGMPSEEDEVIVGRMIADLLGLKAGDAIVPEGGGMELKVTGIFETGSDEDASIIMSLDAVRRLTGIRGVSAILLNVEPSMIESMVSRIRQDFPYLRVKTIRQIAVAEERLLRKIQLLLSLVTIVVVFSSAVSLASTMGANVIERMEEIGLMMALGARKGDVRRFFFYEALFEGVAGTVGGIIVGVVMAEGISISAFGSYASVDPLYLLLPLFTGLLLSVTAISIPVRDAVRVSPSVILRGE